MKRLEGVRLTKRADALGVEGRRRRPRVRWEDCVKKDLVGVGAEWSMRARDRGEWRMRARDRGEWRMRARDRGEWRMRRGIEGSGG